VGFWGRLFGRTEFDTTVTDYQASGAARRDAPASAVSAASGAARPLRFEIEDVFFITGRGTVATGKVSSGILSVGDAVEVVRADGTRIGATVTGVEAFRKKVTSAEPGEMVGVLLDTVTRHDLARGDTLEAR
jgi:translation elongation factor EF-Tu-like GTPase